MEETYEKCSFVFEFKEGENFNHPDLKFIGTGIHTLGILRLNLPKFGGGLKIESDAEIGEKGVFYEGLRR